jgi:hypothetical protein
MKVSEVNNNDGKLCAQLINLLKHGKWELTGPDITAHADTVRWVHSLASLMAEQLSPGITKKPEASAPVAPQMRIKAMGPVGSASPSKPKRNKKK